MGGGVLLDRLRCGHQGGGAVPGAFLHYGAAGEGGEGEVEEPAFRVSFPTLFLVIVAKSAIMNRLNLRNDTSE